MVECFVGPGSFRVIVDNEEFFYSYSEFNGDDINVKDNLYVDENGCFYILDNDVKKVVRVKYILNYLLTEGVFYE